MDVVTLQAAKVAGDSRYERLGQATTRIRAAIVGSSREAGNTKSPNGTIVDTANTWDTMDAVGIQQGGPNSWFTHACLRSGGRMLAVINYGVSSERTPAMLSSWLPIVLTKHPTHVFLGDAHNDFTPGSGITDTQTRSNIVSMIALIFAAGATPILYTTLPDNNQQYAHRIRSHNNWLRQYAEDHRLLCVDPAAAVVDPTSTSGNYVAANTSDGTHLTVAGAILAADRVLNDLSGLLRGYSSSPVWLPKQRVGGVGRSVTNGATTNGSIVFTSASASFTTADVGRPISGTGIPAGTYISAFTNSTTVNMSQAATATGSGLTVVFGPHLNLLSNPLMQDDANSDGIADFWSVTGSGTTKSLITDTAVLGKAQRVVIASSVGAAHQQVSVDGAAVSVGDRIKWVGLFKVSGSNSTFNLDVQLLFLGASTYTVKPITNLLGNDYAWAYFECEAVVPTGATTVRAGWASTAGTGTVDMGNCGLFNMTKLATPLS